MRSWQNNTSTREYIQCSCPAAAAAARLAPLQQPAWQLSSACCLAFDFWTSSASAAPLNTSSNTSTTSNTSFALVFCQLPLPLDFGRGRLDPRQQLSLLSLPLPAASCKMILPRLLPRQQLSLLSLSPPAAFLNMLQPRLLSQQKWRLLQLLPS